jgi:hypothetical protein
MTSPLEKLRAMARNTSPPYEKNERNEISPPAGGPEALLSFNSFLSYPDTGENRGRGARSEGGAGLEQSAVVDLDERAAIVECSAGVRRLWAEGFAALCAMPPPTGISAERWRRIIDAAGKFLDTWTGAAIACGWGGLDLFGCHPTRPNARFDAMGLVLLLDRCEVVGIDEQGADLVTTAGARQRYRRRPLPPGTVSLWELTLR